MSETAATNPWPDDDVILYDGVCVFCSRWVRFVAARDEKRRFRFTAIQSGYGTRLAQAFGISPDDPDTNAVIHGGIAANVIPAEAHAELNFRYAPGRTPAAAEARLASLVPHGELDVLSNSPSAPPSLRRMRPSGAVIVGTTCSTTSVPRIAATSPPSACCCGASPV